MFAFDHDDITPDIVVLGKALGGGMLPIAGIIAHERLNVAGDFAIGHYTHEKNPVTARAALTTLDIIEDEGLIERSATLGTQAQDRLKTELDTHPHVGDIRGRGLMFGVEIVTDRDSRTPDPDRAERIYYACLDHGLSFKISAGNVLTLSPPLVIRQQDLDMALTIVVNAIRAAE
jgi:4-aminobutyrate aminotransferase